MAQSKTAKALIVICSVIVVAFFVSIIRGVTRPVGAKIAVVEIEGMISDSKEAMKNIVKFKEDDSIRGIILRINSPGGAVGPTQEIYREVIKLKEKKPVYVSMGSLCASGGYYIASAGQRIYANPSTVTGSIGVIMQLAMLEGLIEKLGIQMTTIKAGAFKDAGTPFREMTKEERAYFNSVVESIHAQFIKDVAAGRKMEVEKIRKLADGRVFTGTQAKELGLVDGLGNFYDTVDEFKKVLKISGKPNLVYAEKPFSFSKWLIGSLARDLVNERFSSPFKFLFSPQQ
ncbi:MAG TPA: signal peptide peptidase SppA [Deltaproteobacteria bacterium]|nr:signal peptide peptidase SppA [Deltaproteobacteria bacterium]